MANEIIIAKGGVSVTYAPGAGPSSTGGDVVVKETTMASGKVVRDVIGFRPTVRADWDWVPADTIKALNSLLQQGGFFQVTHPTPDGEKTESMTVPFPNMEVFAYRNGVPIWHNISLTMTAQEVIRRAAVSNTYNPYTDERFVDIHITFRLEDVDAKDEATPSSNGAESISRLMDLLPGTARFSPARS